MEIRDAYWGVAICKTSFFPCPTDGPKKPQPSHEERVPHSPHSPSFPRKKWKNMKIPSKKCLQNGNVGVIMIDGLFSKGVKRSES